MAMHICLLTDFGIRDPYVAAMKGVIAGRTEAEVVDLTHAIAPFDILEAAWFLRAVVPHWPEQTIFVAVVDPGVGSDRRIVAARSNGQLFLAPDNGLLSLVVSGDAELRSVENAGLFLSGTSTTFHGRDRFAPLAAALANGLPLEDVGPPMSGIVRLGYSEPQYEAERALGSVVAIDRFGNLITDLDRSRIEFEPFELSTHGLVVDRLERTYADAQPGPFLIVGSSGCLEISVANGSAAERLGIRRLDPVELRRRAV